MYTNSTPYIHAVILFFQLVHQARIWMWIERMERVGPVPRTPTPQLKPVHTNSSVSVMMTTLDQPAGHVMVSLNGHGSFQGKNTQNVSSEVLILIRRSLLFSKKHVRS